MKPKNHVFLNIEIHYLYYVAWVKGEKQNKKSFKNARIRCVTW